METIKLIMQIIGFFSVISAIGLVFLFTRFYKINVIDYVDEEMKEIHTDETLSETTIDDVLEW